MSQHLITEFINRTYVFKPFQDSKLVNRRIKTFQASNRKNHVYSKTIAEDTHVQRSIPARKSQENDSQNSDDNKHIDVVV